MSGTVSRPPQPPWLKVRLPFAVGSLDPAGPVREQLRRNRMATVCEEAACPNLAHCWSQGTATFMVMGDRCTRRCGFCNVATARPLALDEGEPLRVAETVRELGLRHVVITSVDRDELPDCGSAHFADVISSVRSLNRATTIEALIPDFKGRRENLERIWAARPDILNHNVETVPSLYREICPQSNYEISLAVLEMSAEAGLVTKSGVILGLGESDNEVLSVLHDLGSHRVAMLTMGQYMQPSQRHAPVRRYVPPEEFRRWKETALGLGFSQVESGPLVRSSYHAEGSASMLGIKAP